MSCSACTCRPAAVIAARRECGDMRRHSRRRRRILRKADRHGSAARAEHERRCGRQARSRATRRRDGHDLARSVLKPGEERRAAAAIRSAGAAPPAFQDHRAAAWWTPTLTSRRCAIPPGRSPARRRRLVDACVCHERSTRPRGDSRSTDAGSWTSSRPPAADPAAHVLELARGAPTTTSSRRRQA